MVYGTRETEFVENVNTSSLKGDTLCGYPTQHPSKKRFLFAHFSFITQYSSKMINGVDEALYFFSPRFGMRTCFEVMSYALEKLRLFIGKRFDFRKFWTIWDIV